MSQELINAIELITANRIDLISKYKYVQQYDQGKVSAFNKACYLSFIDAFTDGRFVEEDNTNRKHCAEDYINTFHNLIDDIKNYGYDYKAGVIPVTKRGDIDNGAHRTAIAAYYGISVPVRCVENEMRYNYEYFKKKLIDEEMLDYSATEYIKLKKKVYIACFWPRADLDRHSEVLEILKREGSIIYKKQISLSPDGLSRFILQVYAHQSWVGKPEDHFGGGYGEDKKLLLSRKTTDCCIV